MRRSNGWEKINRRMLSILSKITTQALRREWPIDIVHHYIGKFTSSYFAYAADQAFRENAASGGVTTALFSYLMESKEIDGALVCRSVVVDDNVVPKFFIAQDKKALLSAQGSIYSAVEFNRDALPLIKDFNGKLAVVALPCDTKKLNQLREHDEQMAKKIVLILSLFCGHNSRPELTRMILKKLDFRSEGVDAFHYRRGHWRGHLEITLSSGRKIEKPFSYFSDYQNLYYFCQQKCHYCHDHTGYFADISVGDIWSPRMKEEPIKHSAVITRTDAGVNAFQNALEEGWIIAKEEPIAEICEGQARSMPFHYNISARSKAGKLIGIQIKDDVNERVRWNDYITAWMALANEKLTRTESGRKFVAMLPRFVLKFLLYFMKGLESF
ncbi:MAG: Coenzyme F420 hydrogenase/dehydrogenase, beta subunit C-terminal domain [Anaerolineaceae bacterium]|nr:Coenzyme F420 hydrogenase/dehydrogenase, beta subunit C-terminal domain [Anaerolineaceae bacterium]